MKMLSVIIPVYNESEVVGNCLSRVRNLQKNLDKINIDTLQIIVVDDGSSDDSYEISTKFAQIYKNENVQFNIIRLSRNFGHSAAVLAGLERAKGDIVGILDADLQDPPELLVPMIEKLGDGYEVVYGQRMHRDGESYFKRITAWLFYRVHRILSGIDLPKDTGDFRVMTRQVKDAVLLCKEKDPFIRGLVTWVGFRQSAFSYNRNVRELGDTKYNYRAMLKFAAIALVSYSSMPLRISLYIGGIGILITTIIGIWAFTIRLFYEKNVIEPGWASTIIAYTLGQSITLILVGIIGIYIGRIHSELQNRPRYIVWEQDKNESLE